MSDIVWQDPPPGRRAGVRGKWASIFAALRERPGQWALVLSGGGSGGALTTMAKRHGLETTSRTRPDGTYDIYMRAPEEGS